MPPVGTRVIFEHPDPRGACWPFQLLEGRVHSALDKWGYVEVNVGPYKDPPKSDLIKVHPSRLVW